MSISQIESLRFEDPEASLQLADELLRAEHRLVPSLWIMCELGTSLRACGQLSRSAECLTEVVAAAGKRRERTIRADALWRLATTRMAQGHLGLAVSLSSESAMEAAMAGARQQIGMAFFVRGISRFHLGNSEECEEDFAAADHYLTRPVDRASLAINRYTNSKALGQPTSLPAFNIETLPPTLRIGLLWVEARESAPTAAVGLLSKIFELTVDRHDWVNAALSGTEMVNLLACEGKYLQAAEAVELLRPILFKLEDNPLARGALGGLVKAAYLKDVALENAAKKCLAVLRSLPEALAAG